jgi:hypothetical protein
MKCDTLIPPLFAMSCSKIFSGDLPELTYDVIKYLQNDSSTLHSCILVNRLWCRLAIPLLWENPFSIPTKNYNFIEIYLHNLNNDSKTKLNEYLNDNLLPLNTLFNYPSFIKYLNTLRIASSITRWSKDAVRILKPGKRDSCSIYNFKKLICISLFKSFIESEVSLHNLDIKFSRITEHYSCFDDVFNVILENPDFIHKIKNLNLYIGPSYSKIDNRILQIINLHQNLKKILLEYNGIHLYQSLLLSKDYNCSNTLNTLILYGVNFKGIINLDKVFEQLNVLESVHIIYCYPLNTGFIQQIINLTKPFKLKSLFINRSSQIDESLILLLQKSGKYLENFGCNFILDYSLLLKQQILGSIIKYCKNSIKFLTTDGFESQIIYLIFNLIGHIKTSLNYLSIINDQRVTNGNIEYNSIILQNLGQNLPSKLEYLNLSFHIKASDFEIFLKNSQDTFIKKLLINNIEGQDILPYIKEYIMKKKRVKYLAIMESTSDIQIYDKRELFSLKDEVEEFRLYSIKVQSYYSLVIKIHKFVD